MEKTIIQDRWNSKKQWIIKRYKSGHFYVNQIVGGKLLYKRFTRMTKKQIDEVFA